MINEENDNDNNTNTNNANDENSNHNILKTSIKSLKVTKNQTLIMKIQ